MLKPEPMELAQIINNQIRTLAEEGALDHLMPDPDRGYTCQAVFGFNPWDVDGIHTHKQGHGDGLWFRLRDGQVVDACGEASESDPALYDTVEN